MKIYSILSFFALISLWYILSSNVAGAPANWSGAPQEGTCSTGGGCHNAGKYTNGVVTISGLPSEIAPNKTYSITVSANVPSALNGGFQITALDASNIKSGVWKAGANQKLVSSNSPAREYVTHSKSTLYANGQISWICSWQSPATSNNKNIIFYAAVLAANSNGNEKGDVAFATSQKVAFKSTATDDLLMAQNINVYPNPMTNVLNINLLKEGNGSSRLINESGKLIMERELVNSQSFDVTSIESGVYFLTVICEGKSFTKVLLKY